MARITRVLLAAAAAVAAAGLAIAIVSSVSGHHATGSVVAPAAPEAAGRRASAAALFRSLRDRAFGGAAASAAAVGEAVDSAKEAVLALGPTPTPANAASIFGSLRDRALGGAAASAAAVGEAVDSAKEAVLALGPTSTPLAVSTGQALQAQLLAAQNAAYGLAQRFTGGVGGGLDALLNAHQPRASLDVVETENELQVLADLAGFAPGDVRVEVDDTGVLSVHAAKAQSDKTPAGTWCCSHAVTRAISLPAGVDLDSTSAEMKHGLLSVSVRKLPPHPTKARGKRAIPVSASFWGA